MPGVYDKMGIRFLYPDNWTLDQKDAVGGNLSVTVEAPGGAFLSVAVHPLAIDTAELALTALDALRAEYPAAESEPASEQILDQTASGYDVSFFYLDFVNTATIRTLRTPVATCLVLCQAEDREYEALAPVFRAITTSLLTPK